MRNLSDSFVALITFSLNLIISIVARYKFQVFLYLLEYTLHNLTYIYF